MEELNKSMEISKLFRDIMILIRHQNSKLFENSGITAPQGFVIGTLSKNGKMKITELSKNIGLTNSTTSGIIDRLEKQGMVERERSETDKRIVYVKMSSKFEETNRDFHKKMGEKLSNIMSKATPEEMEKIYTGLSTFKKLLECCKADS